LAEGKAPFAALVASYWLRQQDHFLCIARAGALFALPAGMPALPGLAMHTPILNALIVLHSFFCAFSLSTNA
jgi:hypothetical protein